VVIFTLLYFWPLNDVLLARDGQGVDTATLVSMARRWIIADRIRYCFRFAALLCILKAMWSR
jgi:hypothetical protein